MKSYLIGLALISLAISGCSGGHGALNGSNEDTTTVGTTDAANHDDATANDGTETPPPATGHVSMGGTLDPHSDAYLPGNTIGQHQTPRPIDPWLPNEPTPPTPLPDPIPGPSLHNFDMSEHAHEADGNNVITNGGFVSPAPLPRPSGQGGLSNDLAQNMNNIEDGQAQPLPCAETPQEFYDFHRWCPGH